MNPANMLEELLEILDNNGVEIRRESLGGSGGGLCNMKGKKIFFVDRQGNSTDTAVVCASALSELVDLDNIYIKPQVREFIEYADSLGNQDDKR
jgi:hypothetical protein